MECEKLLAEENAFVYISTLAIFVNEETERAIQFLNKSTGVRTVRLLEG
jgi:hypothetical protein